MTDLHYITLHYITSYIRLLLYDARLLHWNLQWPLLHTLGFCRYCFVACRKSCPAPLLMPSMLEHRPVHSYCLLFLLWILRSLFCRSPCPIPLSHLHLFCHTWLLFLSLTWHYYLVFVPRSWNVLVLSTLSHLVIWLLFPVVSSPSVWWSSFHFAYSAVLRHRPARPGPRAPAEQGAPLSPKYIF